MTIKNMLFLFAISVCLILSSCSSKDENEKSTEEPQKTMEQKIKDSGILDETLEYENEALDDAMDVLKDN